MQLRMIIGIPVILAALAAIPAQAELYKWVDARGVTNYSNQPPADLKTARKLATVEDKISVYTPDKALLDAVEANRQQLGNRIAAEKIASLERQLEEERRARQYAAATMEETPIPLYSRYPYYPTAFIVPGRSRAINAFTPIPGMNSNNFAGAPARHTVHFRPGHMSSSNRGNAMR